MCRIYIDSSLCAPDEWGELVPSKIFNPSFLTLKVGHLVAFTFYHVFYRGFGFKSLSMCCSYGMWFCSRRVGEYLMD